MSVACFDSVCVPLPNNVSWFPQNLTWLNLTLGQIPPGQPPFTGYVSLWLIGVIISSIVIVALIVWTAAQARIRESMRKKRSPPDDNSADRDLDNISMQFATSSVKIGSMNAESHLASLKKANPGSESLMIDFANLSLVLLHGHGKHVLNNINGVLFPGSMTAIMGPSGSGKTSLLTAVAGRANYGKMTGTVKINGVEEPISKYKTIVGFVPQEDVMIRTLTVRQVLTFSALMRLPRNLSSDAKKSIVDGVIKVLKLGGVQDQVIGDETFRGISGGQRKRVNIGIELVSGPLALFLDEPTSGLDSTSAYEAISSLLTLLPLNINIAAVVHQPREDIFNLFDRLLLLSDGGRTVFSGKRVLMIPYFRQIGFDFDEKKNPADQVLDIISGRRLAVDGVAHDLPALWEAFSAHERQRARLPSVDEQNLAEFQHILAQRQKRLEESQEDAEESPMHQILHHGESARNKVFKAVLACSFSFLGCIVCIILLSLRYPNEAIYLRVIVPYCSVALAMFVGTICFVIVAYFKLTSPDLMEKCCFFAAGSVLGPLALLAGIVWQSRKKSRFYLFWLYLCAGFGAWTVIMCAAAGTAMAMRANNYSSEWNFTQDVAVCWLLFVCAPFGFVVLMSSIIRIYRRTDSSVRPLAPFVMQVKHQFVRALTEAWTQPAGLLLDFLLAAGTAIMIGLTTSGRWGMPILEQLAAVTKTTPFPITDCFSPLPGIACSFISVPQPDPLYTNALFIPLVLGLIGVISSLRFFGFNKANFERESRASASTTAVFFAKSMLVILISCVTSGIFLSFWGYLTQPSANAGLYFLLFLVALFSASSLGLMVSICLRLELAGMVGILIILVFTLFSATLAGSGTFPRVISYFSINNWASVAFYTVSVEPFNAVLTPWMQNAYGFSPANQSFAWNQLFCLGLFMRLLAWLALVFKEK